MVLDSSSGQLSGIVVGGLVGGLAGFAANLLRLRIERGIQRSNVASALAAEIEAICDHASAQYMKQLKLIAAYAPPEEAYPYGGFRSEREYMPVFRVLGQNLGALPRPLPRELISWYTTLTICLERARDLYELAKSQIPGSREYALAMVRVQSEEMEQLVQTAHPLIQRLELLAEGRWFSRREQRRESP
jgi:hypothetical protein